MTLPGLRNRAARRTCRGPVTPRAAPFGDEPQRCDDRVAMHANGGSQIAAAGSRSPERKRRGGCRRSTFARSAWNGGSGASRSISSANCQSCFISAEHVYARRAISTGLSELSHPVLPSGPACDVTLTRGDRAPRYPRQPSRPATHARVHTRRHRDHCVDGGRHDRDLQRRLRRAAAPAAVPGTSITCSGCGPTSPGAIERRSTCRISSTTATAPERLTAWPEFFNYGASLSDEASGERLQGLRATGNFFDVLGARPRLGGCCNLATSAGRGPCRRSPSALWMRRFGGDAGIVGRLVRLNGDEYVVVGVLALGFVTPVRDVGFVMPFSPDHDPAPGRAELAELHHRRRSSR